MEKTKHTIQLDRPKVLLAQERPWGRWAFYFAMMALGVLGAFSSFLTAFEIPVQVFPLCLGGLGSCGFWLWRRADTRKHWWSWTFLGWVVWLLFCIFLFDQALYGAVGSLNRMLSAYSAKLNYVLPVLELPSGAARAHTALETGATAFWGLLAFPFFGWLSRILIKRRSHLEAFALTSVFLLLPMGFSIVPEDWAFGAVLLFWGTLVLTGPSLGGREALSGKRYRASGANAAGFSLLLVPGAVLVCLGLLSLSFPRETYTRPELAAQLRVGVEKGLGLTSSSRRGQGSGNSRVDLDKLGGRNYSGETMLRARFQWRTAEEHTRKEYLKSFVGSVYTGRSWEQLDKSALDELAAIDLRAQGLPAEFGQEIFVSGIDAESGYQLEIENVGGNTRCVYIPYGLDLDISADSLKESGAALVDDGFAKAASFFFGVDRYQLESVPIDCGWGYYGRISEYAIYDGDYTSRILDFARTIYTPDRTWSATSGMFRINPFSLQVSRIESRLTDTGGAVNRDMAPEICDELLTSFGGQVMAAAQASANGWSTWQNDYWKAGDELRKYFSESQWALMKDVEDYTDFVYRHYTQLPEELAEFLGRYRQAFDLQPSYFPDACRDGAEFFAYRIADVFQKYYSYSLDPPRPDAGEDFVEFFLDQSHQGYCVHFATAAVALLRSAGYPARYAEGYVAPSGQSGWVDVPDYNAHAWVEVYTAGMGWVPVEVTPASADAPAAYNDATAPDLDEMAEATPQPVEAMPTLPPRDPQRRPGQEEGTELAATAAPQATAAPSPAASRSAHGEDWSWGPAAAAVGASLLLVVLVLLLGRYLRVSRRKKALANQDRNQAALRAYAYLLKLYQWEALCGQREEQPPRWKELAEKARFGRGMLSPEELAELTEDCRERAAKLRAMLPKMQKLRCWLEGIL